MKRLFLLLVIPFIIGIYISYNLVVDRITAIIVAILLVAGLVISFVLEKGYNLVLFVLFIFLGMIMTLNSVKSDLDNFYDKDLVIEGVIENRTALNEDKSTYVVKVNRLFYNNKLLNLEEKILLNYYDKEILDVGYKIRVKGRLLLPRENTNPGLFNYRLYLQTKDIHTTLNSDSSSLYIISKDKTSQKQILRLKFQEKIISILKNTLDEKNSRIMSSIILGQDSFLDEETGTRFRELGLSHILAVSGLHIGIIYLFIAKILKLLGTDKKFSVIISLIIIWIYAFLIGFPASVLRSSIMFSILSLSALFYRRYDSINTLSFAALLLIMIRPLWIFDVGFQLSFVATTSIIILTPRINCLLSIYSKTVARLLSSLIAVQIGLFPILAYHFNSYAVISLMSNLILIPIFSFSLVLCFILIIVSIIFINPIFLLGYLLNIILNAANFIIDTLYKFSFINLSLPSLGIRFILLFYLVLLAGLRIIRIDFFKPKINKLIFNYMILVILVGFFNVIIFNETTLEFIDVGQGDSCLVSTKDKVFLIDTGGTAFSKFDVGERIVLPFLVKKGINRLDAVFISHFHEDHAEGLISLLNNIKIDNIFIGYENTENELFNEIMHLSNMSNTKVFKIYENDSIYLDNNNFIKVLNPSYNMSIDTISNENNLSMVLNLISYNKKILFTGDIEKESEYKIINNFELGKIDIIKAPHHGSSTSSTPELLKAASPSYTVIQVGKNNFGHPNTEVLDRYKQIGAKVLRNDENGLITFRINNNGIKIHTYVKDKPTINDIIIKYRYELLFLFIYIISSYFMCKIYAKFSFNLRNSM
ncbi:DNA internalization-related competence protein ComEC/Rec2 [Proteiniborus sp.]|uniref:DNA internalization-related competence protein ComEC/Rec2 n=1 Tax=Proteiniborus sp. TaxID=2079015 RepID=UPI00331F476F